MTQMETRLCVMCDKEGATFDDSARVTNFMQDDGTMPPAFVHMTQPDDYWFNDYADFGTGETGPRPQLVDSVPGVHLKCYLEWLVSNAAEWRRTQEAIDARNADGRHPIG